MTRPEDVWHCEECSQAQGRHDMWFNGKCGECNSKFTIRVLPYGDDEESLQRWTLDEILEEINRDHSDQWTDYDETDWEEGWNEWVEGEFYSMLDAEGKKLN